MPEPTGRGFHGHRQGFDWNLQFKKGLRLTQYYIGENSCVQWQPCQQQKARLWLQCETMTTTREQQWNASCSLQLSCCTGLRLRHDYNQQVELLKTWNETLLSPRPSDQCHKAARQCTACAIYRILSQSLGRGGSWPLTSGRIVAALMSLSLKRLRRLQSLRHKSAHVNSEERRLRM